MDHLKILELIITLAITGRSTTKESILFGIGKATIVEAVADGITLILSVTIRLGKLLEPNDIEVNQERKKIQEFVVNKTNSVNLHSSKRNRFETDPI